MESLYQLTDEYMQLLEMAEDPDVEPEVLKDTMEAIGGEIEIKADGYAKVIRQLSADAEGISAEIERLTARKKAIETNTDRMKKSLQNAMTMTGKTKFKTQLFSFRIQKNAPSVVIDSDNIPKRYLIQQEPKVDRKSISAALKEGKKLAFAHLEQSESLRIQ